MAFDSGNKLHWLRSIIAQDFGEIDHTRSPFRLPKISASVMKDPSSPCKIRKNTATSNVNTNYSKDKGDTCSPESNVPELTYVLPDIRPITNTKHKRRKTSKTGFRDVAFPKLRQMSKATQIGSSGKQKAPREIVPHTTTPQGCDGQLFLH